MTAEQHARYQALLETLRKQMTGVDAVELVLASLEQAVLAGEPREASDATSGESAESFKESEDPSDTDAGREADFHRGKSGSNARSARPPSGHAEHFSRGKSRYRRSPYQVIVHTCPSCRRATVPTDRGEKALTPKELRTILCDARVRDSGGRNKTPIPERTRRTVMERDRHRCRAAGCGRTSFLAVHHLVPREAGGGNTLENLITVCAGCHRALHDRS